MGLQRYPLSPAIWGAGEEIRLTHVVQAALFTDFSPQRATRFIDVDLEANPLSGTWRVRYNGAVIGSVPAADRARFPDVERVHRSLLRPGTTASLSFNAETGQFDVAVILPPPLLAVPRNDTPAGAWVLPPADMLVIDTSAGEFSAEELALLSPGQWLVALHRIDDTVVALYDGRVLGSFNGTDAADITAAVDEALSMGAPEVYARAVLLEGMAGLDVGHPEEGIVLAVFAQGRHEFDVPVRVGHPRGVVAEPLEQRLVPFPTDVAQEVALLADRAIALGRDPGAFR